MFIPLLKAAAAFPEAGWTLDRTGAGELLFDCHHGDIYVLKTTGLTAAALEGKTGEGAIRLEADLTPPTEMVARLENFAAHQNLVLGGPPEPGGELTLQPVLAAAHLPSAKLFIYTESSTLTVRSGEKGRVTLEVQARFKARAVPCQEADLVIHLDKAAAAQLCALFLSQARSGW